MILHDQHVHSIFSSDSRETIEKSCESAINRGLRSITFTEHVDVNPNDTASNYFDYKKYSDAIKKAQDKYKDKLSIFKGIEFGEPHIYEKQFDHFLNLDLDLIMCSVHTINGIFIGEPVLSEKNSEEKIFEKYYIELFKMVTAKDFDVVGHFDFPRRYCKLHYLSQLIDDILKEIIKKNISIEINSSTLRKGLNWSCPDNYIVKKYIEYGGKNFTAGSDAHYADDIGADFDYVDKLLRNNNADKINLYINRKAEEIKI